MHSLPNASHNDSMHPTSLQFWQGFWRLRPVQIALIAFLCLAIAVAAQRSLDRQRGTAQGVLGYAVAATIFVLLTHHIALEAKSREDEAIEVASPSYATLAIALGTALLGCLDFGNNEFRPLGLVLWLGGLFTAMCYLRLILPGNSFRQHLKAWWREKGTWVPAHWLLLVIILAVGAWFRFHRLNEIPADLGPDLIYHYYDTLDILEGKYRIYFPERESLIFYCTALCARIIGLSQFTLHFTSALVGMATIVALYGLGQELFDKQVALLAAFLLAINRWHIALSRSAYPAVFTPLFCTLLLYTLIRVLRLRQFGDFALAGMVLGLGFYTYTPFKASPLFVVVALVLYLLSRRRKAMPSLWPQLLVMVAVALVVLAPVARFAIERPREYFVRELVTLRLKREQAEFDRGLPTYYWRSILGLNYLGDGTSRWNVPGARHMGFVSGMFMVLGLGYALWRWRHGYNYILLAAWFILILPAALGMLPRDTPSSLRMSGVLPPAVLLAALPLPLMARLMQQAGLLGKTDAAQTQRSEESTPASAESKISLSIESPTKCFAWTWRPHWVNLWSLVLIGITAWLLIYETREANHFYFQDFVRTAPDRANYSNAREIAREIEHYGDLQSVYIKIWEFWFDGSALRVNLRLKDRNWSPWVTVLDPQQPPLSTIQGPALFIVHPNDQQALATLRAFFPRGVALPRYYPDGAISFYAFYVE
nr:glycosyltransferase family 39 protein [Chloroflexota bacterium]